VFRDGDGGELERRNLKGPGIAPSRTHLGGASDGETQKESRSKKPRRRDRTTVLNQLKSAIMGAGKGCTAVTHDPARGGQQKGSDMPRE